MSRLRPQRLRLPRAAVGARERLDRPVRAVVVGGGLAGTAAATILAERGASVRLLEKQNYLGGRVGAWTETTPQGDAYEMERGFHGFFRQYYNLRALLRRVDPELSMLAPLSDYPVLAPDGGWQSFRGLPRTTPLNVIALAGRSPALGLRDLMRVDARAALSMLAFDPKRTYEAHDGWSAGQYLDSLRFPPSARRLLFDVFAHSFFNPEREMSAAELLMMFHFYFTGNPEGLVFDVVRQPFSRSLWFPLERHLASLGAGIRYDTSACRLLRRGDWWRIETTEDALDAELVVLALPVRELHALVDACDDDVREPLSRDTRALSATRPFGVLRLWLDRPTNANRPVFAGTTGDGLLDNISLYHAFEDESRDWARRNDGAVVELHGYALPEAIDAATLRADLVAGLHQFYPETRDARIVHERMLIRRDCPAFKPGAWARRPTVETALSGLALAGDFVRLPMPNALMERAVASGMLAANHLLAPYGVAPEPLWSVPTRGLLAGGLA